MVSRNRLSKWLVVSAQAGTTERSARWSNPCLRHGELFGTYDHHRDVAGFSLAIAAADPARPVARHTHEDAHFILLLDGHHVLPGVAAPAFDYLTDLAPFANDGAQKAAITIEDLLTMSSALDCNDDDDASPAADLPVRADYQRDASGRGPWHYCTAGVFLLGQILQRAAREPVDRVMASYLFAPLGITAWEFSRSPAGEIMTGGGLRLRTRDLASFARLMLTRGAWAGTQVVPADFVRAALTVHRDAMPEQHYGYLFWTRDYKTPCGTATGWFMGGNGGNAIVLFVDLDAVVVVTRTSYNTRGMHQQTTRLIEEQILPELACRDGARRVARSEDAAERAPGQS